MHLRMTRSILWTVAALVFFLAALAARLSWTILWVPGLALMWYGVLSANRARKIPVQNRARTGLN
jgi:hypothetical protein